MGLLSGKPTATVVAGYRRGRDENSVTGPGPAGGDPVDGGSPSARAMRAAPSRADADPRALGRIKDIRTLGRPTRSEVEVVCDYIDELGDLSAVISLDLGGILFGIEASPPEVACSD